MDLETPAVEISQMTKLQKLAALLTILGPEGAAQILKILDEHELEAVSLEMSRLTIISQELQWEILREFSDVALQAGTGILGGVGFTRAVLEKSVGALRASDIIGRVAPTPAPVAAMKPVIDMEAGHLCKLLKQEQPQTIALIASYLSPGKSSQLLLLLPSELRDQVVERLATLAPTPVGVVERIAEVLNRRARAKPACALNQAGGVKNAADLLSALDKNIGQSMLIDLEKRNPELGQAVRQKMFNELVV
jgi:flagellar motor switch protein FliG